jgi:hypothetical protein
MLNLLFALLELDYGLLRAVTPYYELYALSAKAADGLDKVRQDTSVEGKAINKYWNKGPVSALLRLVLTAYRSTLSKLLLNQVYEERTFRARSALGNWRIT